MSVKVDTASHGVDDTLWLFVNFLLHKVRELALHDLRQFQFQSLDGADSRSSGAGGGGIRIVAAKSMDMHFSFADVGNVVVFKVQDALGMLNNSRGV